MSQHPTEEYAAEFLFTDSQSEPETRSTTFSGLVLNSGSLPWLVDGGPTTISIGCRVGRAPTGEWVEIRPELRGTMAGGIVEPGAKSWFSFPVATSLLPARIRALRLGLLKEGTFWFSELGGEDCVVELPSRGQGETMALLAAALRRLKTRDPRSVIVADVLAKFDFSVYDPITRLALLLARDGAEQPVPPPSPEVLAEALDAADRRDGTGSRRRDAFYLGALAARGGPAVELSTISPPAVADMIKGGPRDGAFPPLPRHVTRWLASSPVAPSSGLLQFTNGMILLLDEGTQFPMKRPSYIDELAWRWFTTVCDLSGSRELLPDSVSRRLQRAVRHGPSMGFPPLSTGLARLHQESETHRERYALRSDAGACAFVFDFLIHSLDNEARRQVLGQALMDWFLDPIVPGHPWTGPLILMLLAYTNAADHLTVEFQDRGEPEFGVNQEALTGLRDSADWLAPGFTDVQESGVEPIALYGLANSPTGLGANLAMSAAALRMQDYAVRVVDSRWGGVSERGGGHRMLARPVDLYHLNCDEVPTLVRRFTSRKRRDVYRIGFTLWETSIAPEAHRPGMDLCDELWVPTNYVRDAYLAIGAERVRVVGKGIDLPDPVPFDRSRLGIGAEFVFLVSYDVHSWVERKNPISAIRAFQRAFPDPAARVRLVVKTTEIAPHDGDPNGQQNAILAAADLDPRIIVLDEIMPFRAYLGLIKACDAAVSPHRAEGFGYFAAYAMLLGTPVILTDYSGTYDFCNEENAYPVAYRERELRPGEFVLRAGGVWADIDVDHLAARMVECVENPDNRLAKIAMAAGVRAKYSMDALSASYVEALNQV